MFFKKNLINLFSFIIIINFFYNIVKNESYINEAKLAISELISLSLISYFFFYLSKNIKNILKISSTSFAFSIFILSYFIFNNLFLFFGSKLSFEMNFIIVSIIWILIFIFNKKISNLSKILLFTFTQLAINKFLFVNLTKNLNLKGDVLALWFPTVKNIYESSYYNSLIISPLEGYGQLIPYINAIILKISFNSEGYVYLLPTTRLFVVATIFLFFELKLNLKTKILVSVVYLALIFNNHFWSFLYSDSLMAEGISAYLFTQLVLLLFNQCYKSKLEQFLSFFCFGFLYLTKQFFSTFILITILYFLFFKKQKFTTLSGLFCFFLNLINYKFLLPNIKIDPYLSQIDIQDTLFDLILMRDLNIQNLITILNNIMIDKILTIVLLFLFSIIFIKLIFGYKINKEISIPLFSYIVFNIVFVLLLYISVWRDMELESPVRFIVAFILLKIIVIFKESEFNMEYK